VIELYRTVLEDGRSLHGIALNPEDTKRLLGFSFRSVKPLRIVLNLGESDVFDPDRVIRASYHSLGYFSLLYRREKRVPRGTVTGELHSDIPRAR
jgi:hypothetical protein